MSLYYFDDVLHVFNSISTINVLDEYCLDDVLL